jgi:hypothetical protein
MSEDNQGNSGARPRANRLLLGKLYEKQSQGGQRYFQGVLGFLKVLVFHDDRAEAGNEWNFFVVERDPADSKPRQFPGNNQGPQQQQPNSIGQGGGYGAQTPPRQGGYQQQGGYPPRQQQPRQLPPEGNPLDDTIPF